MLTNVIPRIRETLSVSPSATSLFHLVLHDWFAYLIEDTPMLPQYGTTLYQVISKSVDSSHLSQLRTSQRSSYRLLNRHYLAEIALQEDLHLTLESRLFYAIIGSFGFTPLEASQLEIILPFDWVRLDTLDINHIHRMQPTLRMGLIDLANREDITDDHERVNHALLSSYMLLYGCITIVALLTFIHNGYDDKGASLLRDHMSGLVLSLKGVLLHGQKN